MKSVGLLFLLIVISSGLGRVLLNRFAVLQDVPLERFAYGTAVGLGFGALGVFALGIVGRLSFVPITLWWILLAAIGLRGTVQHVRDTVRWLARRRPDRSVPSEGTTEGTDIRPADWPGHRAPP